MQTIASMANRLDMNSEEALATLRKLAFDIKDDQTPLSDEQCDILIEVDEDPSAMDAYLAEKKKKEEEAKKKTERLQKAAKKAAATRKKAAAKKKTTAKKKPAAKKKATAKKKEETEEEAADADSTAAPEAEAPAAEVLADVLETPETTQEETPAPAAVPDTPRPVAEILPDEAEPFEHKPLVKPAPKVEIKPEDLPDDAAPDAGAPGESDTLLPQPDPEVVAEVIRKAQERARQKQAKSPRTPEVQTGFTEGPPGAGAPGAGKGAKKTGKTARKKQKRKERMKVMDDALRRDAAAAVREYQSGGMLGGAPKKKRKKQKREDGEEFLQEEFEYAGGTVEIEEGMTLEQIGHAMEIPVNDLILELMEDNILANKNQILDIEVVRRLAAKFNFEVKAVIPEEEDIMKEEPDDPADLQLRPPVITVMGHVDHGKTSLLDMVRSANVAEGEAGGITQHIAAYDVELPTGRVVFLDTPGHEAFTQMRSRGAQVTDVVVLVVAADDGIKPQTVEAIDHAKAAEVPIVVAVNKCDKPEAKPDKVRQELTQYELVPEEWGGKTQMVNISALSGEGVDSLMELLALESEMLELKANPNKRARGAVIESEMTLGQGPVAWVLVQSGTLRTGDVFVVGTTYGRVRTMTNSQGKQVAEAGPSTPVLVTGLNQTANAGDQFVVLAEERVARTIANKRETLRKQKQGAGAKHVTLEDFHALLLAGEQKNLNIIVKADVQGSVDVLQTSCAKIGNEEVRVNIVHSGVGGVNESDVILASASDAVIIAFQVTANAKVQKLAEQEGVEIRGYRVIYEAIEELHNALEGLLTPDKKEIVTGHAEIRQVFRSSALGNIAGSYQLDGTTERNARMRLLRDDVIVYEGTINSIRREKDDVKSISAGYECGIKIDNFNDIQVGDIIECYKIESVAKTLS